MRQIRLDKINGTEARPCASGAIGFVSRPYQPVFFVLGTHGLIRLQIFVYGMDG